MNKSETYTCFVRRKFTLVEHWLIAESLLKKNSAIKGLYRKVCLDISQKGIVDIYDSLEDYERNLRWVVRGCKKNPAFPGQMLKRGRAEIEGLSKIPIQSLRNFKKKTDKEILNDFETLRKKFFRFGAFLDFTHYLGRSGVTLKSRDLEALSKFHDQRKITFSSYLDFFKDYCRKIGEKNKIKPEKFLSLSSLEIKKFLNGKLPEKEIDKLYKERRAGYIAWYKGNKEAIITRNFPLEVKKLEKKIKAEENKDEIKGMGINKKIVKGEVLLISQKDKLEKIRPGRIIVTYMTTPFMIPYLKKAAGIITDEGGILCHAAIVAREFGIPTIVGTNTATKILKSGNRVELDTEKGVVKILK